MLERLVCLFEEIAKSLKAIEEKFVVAEIVQAAKQIVEAAAVATPGVITNSQVIEVAPTPPVVQAAKQIVEAAAVAVPSLATVTREQCGNALITLATSKGRDAAVAVLSKFGGGQFKDVKEADYPAFFAAITEAGK